MNLKCCLIAAGGVMLTASITFGLQARLSLQEIAQNADLIFVGTVTRQSSHYNARRTAIETDVTFSDVSIEQQSARAQQRGARTIHLTYAGGEVGDVSFSVSDSPTFETGRRYLVFMTDDGSRPFNPVIGAFQGMFEVFSDPVTRREHLRTVGGRAVTGVDDDGNVLSTPQPVDSITAGVPAFRTESRSPASSPADPYPVGPGGSVGPRVERASNSETPMTTDEFVNHVRNVSLKKNVERPQLRRERSGRFYRQVDGAIVSQPLEERALDVATIDEKLRQAGLSMAGNSIGADESGGTVSASAAWYEPLMNCGRREYWPFTMETLEFGGWEWFATYDNPLTFNHYVDLFRPIGPYPGWDWNGANEFIGYPSDAEMIAAYGFGMGGSLAMTISVAVGGWCNTIVESDIAWSRYVNWTDNLFIALDPSNYARHIYPVTMHELGHTVGLSRALPENYEHDYLTYMDGALNSNVVEDGRGLHAADAINLRANYGSSTNIADMGVESYYADTWTAFSGWLTSPGPDYGTNRLRTPLHPGDTFTANQLTVENMSQFAHSNVHIRLLLSTDPTINALDRQIGDWYWPTFWGDSYWEGDLTGNVPLDMPPGTYYVGLWVTINGYQGDGYSDNNKTFFSDKLTISPQNNHPPVASSDSLSTNEDEPLVGQLNAQDVDGNALTWTLLTTGAHGIAALTDASTGAFTYTPTANYHGFDSFTFRVNDGTVDSAVATIDVTVTSVNDVPTANGQSVATQDGIPVPITLGASDADGDTLTYTIVQNSAHGSLTGSGANRTYSPTSGYVGSDSFTFSVNDGTVSSNLAAVNLTVTAITKITSFTPTSGAEGLTVTINGTNFTGATAVTFNGVDATTFTIVSSIKITGKVPINGTTGPIAVTTPLNTATSSTHFKVAPTITSFTPLSGAVGASVTLNGLNFTGATAVKFNGTAATFTVSNATQMTTTVPANATTGKMTVTTAAGTATSADTFTVAPRITSFTPAGGPYGTTVTINGVNFTGASAVKFNGIPATTFTVNTSIKITATVPTGATTGSIGVTTAAGTGTSATPFTVTFLPTISSFTPTSGAPVSLVTITGTNYTSVSSVKFNGTTAGFTVNSPTQITATVPSLATTGPITVTTASGTATSSTNYTVAPRITSFTPTSGAVGASVTVAGANFTAATSVKFNGVTAAVTVNTASSISATVPAGATTGKITVTTAVGTATSGTNFTVKPAIASFTPMSGASGAAVTITGTTFTGATAVKFNGVTASFIVNTSTQITATVPATATTGPITVTTPGGTATSAINFTVAPRITSFSPTSGAVGTSVVINGANFTGATSVKFGGISASVVVNTAVKITATVPTGAVTGTIAVTTSAGTVVSGSNFTVLP